MDDDPVDFASTDSRLPVPTTLSFCGQVQGMITKQSVAQQHNGPSDQHRTSCHRCGNIRKKTHYCSKCPYVFCFRCVIKMQEVHGSEVFADGCPVCQDMCCCGTKKSFECTQMYHCYKKCPVTRPNTMARFAKENALSHTETAGESKTHAAVDGKKALPQQKPYYGNRSKFLGACSKVSSGDQLPKVTEKQGSQGQVLIHGFNDPTATITAEAGQIETETNNSIEDQNVMPERITSASAPKQRKKSFRSTGTDPMVSPMDVEATGGGGYRYILSAESDQSRATAVASYSDAADIFATPSLYHPVAMASSSESDPGSGPCAEMDTFYLGSVGHTPNTATPSRGLLAHSYLGDYSQATYDCLFQNNSPILSHTGNTSLEDNQAVGGGLGGDSGPVAAVAAGESYVASVAAPELTESPPAAQAVLHHPDSVSAQEYSRDSTGSQNDCIRDLLMMSPEQTQTQHFSNATDSDSGDRIGSAEVGTAVTINSSELVDSRCVSSIPAAISSEAVTRTEEGVLLLLGSKQARVSAMLTLVEQGNGAPRMRKRSSGEISVCDAPDEQKVQEQVVKPKLRRSV